MKCLKTASEAAILVSSVQGIAKENLAKWRLCAKQKSRVAKYALCLLMAANHSLQMRNNAYGGMS